MGTTQQKSPKPETDKAYADWVNSWKRDRQHTIAEKQALLGMVRCGLDYLRLHQIKLVHELEDLAAKKEPDLVPDLGTSGPPKSEKG